MADPSQEGQFFLDETQFRGVEPGFGFPGEGGPTWERQYQQQQLNLRAQQPTGGGRANAQATTDALQYYRAMPVDQAMAELNDPNIVAGLYGFGVDVEALRNQILREKAQGTGTLGVLGGR